jgi:hypothetical protein
MEKEVVVADYQVTGVVGKIAAGEAAAGVIAVGIAAGVVEKMVAVGVVDSAEMVKVMVVDEVFGGVFGQLQ